MGMQIGCDRGFKTFFWLSSAFSISFSMHCLLLGSMVIVFAPGLAIRGPLGSMVRAVDGMIEIQSEMMGTYVTAIFFLCKIESAEVTFFQYFFSHFLVVII